MERRVFDFIEEPSGATLRRLIQNLRRYSSTGMLVLRDDLELSESGRAMVARLEPRLLARKRSAPWPWTELLDPYATLLHFKLDDVIVEEVLRASDGLYGWQQPSLPENLALLRDDGTTILGSITHDHDSWLEVAYHEFESIIRAVPPLVNLVRLHAHEKFERTG